MVLAAVEKTRLRLHWVGGGVGQWFLGCLLFSFAVGIKMNVLLFAPGLLYLLLRNLGVRKTVYALALCAAVQVRVCGG